MKTIFHYWCGAIDYSHTKDKYVMYLLISVDSLINIAKVKPKDIYCTVEKQLHSSKYFVSLKKTGVNILDAPIYKNYSKQYCYSEVIKSNPDIDFMAQIDCDTLVTDPDLLSKIERLEGGINIDWAGGNDGKANNSNSTFDYIYQRDGQKHPPNTIASILKSKDSDLAKSGCPIRYASFKDFLLDQYNVNLDKLIENSKNDGAPAGFFYVLRPKLLPKDFFKFLRFFNFFFQDDEVGISFARDYFKLTYGDRNKFREIKSQAKELSDLETLKGVVHFPPNDDKIKDLLKPRADKIVKENN